MLGCWSAGIEVAYAGPTKAIDPPAASAAVDLPSASAAVDAPATIGPVGRPIQADVAFGTVDRMDELAALAAEEVYVLSLAPLGAPLAAVPASALDYAVEVRSQGDRFVPHPRPDPAGPALRTVSGVLSQVEVGAAASTAADALGLASGDRLLATEPVALRSGLDWLLAPLAAGASLVLVRNPDSATIEHHAEHELVTVRLT